MMIETQQWLATILSTTDFKLWPITSGAGQRRYWRVQLPATSYILMHDPSPEKLLAFIQLAQFFHTHTIPVPAIYAANYQRGWLLLTDFGQDLYEQRLTSATANDLYQRAFESLLRLQTISQHGHGHRLKPFDMEHYQQKMRWFNQFYLTELLQLTLSSQQVADLEKIFTLLVHSAQQQPQVCVHYDFHCRNLLQLPDGQAGVIDFQDAVWGPITYDLMALLRDCYVDWPTEQVMQWIKEYHQKILAAGLLPNDDFTQWLRWCDFCSLQRHIKCVGLFARFHVVGQSSDYLLYIPRLLKYMHDICARYPELTALNALLKKIDTHTSSCDTQVSSRDLIAGSNNSKTDPAANPPYNEVFECVQ